MKRQIQENITMRTHRLLPIARFTLVLASGCSQHQQAIATKPAIQQRGQDQPTVHHMLAPFLLLIEGPQPPMHGELELVVKIQSQLEQPAEVDLELYLPQGIALLDGPQKQTVHLLSGHPTVARAFRIRVVGVLQQPIRFRAQLWSDGTFGAVAEREFPAPPVAAAPPLSEPKMIGGLPISTPVEVMRAR
jgi:hypothetical protein